VRAVSVGRIRAELGVALERERVAADRRADVALFVSGASSNVVVDAYVATRPGPLYGAATLADRNLIVSVCDYGRGMVAHPDSPGPASACR
jgi:anti-sigma regulatory factor (Ser/Thr protein kinase)